MKTVTETSRHVNLAPVAARLLLAFLDFCCDAWYTFRPGCNEFWDNVAPVYRELTPKLGAPPALKPGPVFEGALARRCATCQMPAGSRCYTRLGKQMTDYHKVRELAAGHG